MKNSKKILGLVSIFAFAAVALAASVHVSGLYEITPKVGHKEVLKGTLSTEIVNDQLVAVKVHSDSVVFGKTDFTSSEQWMNQVQLPDGTQQMSLVYKLQGTPHKWYFVWVGNYVAQSGAFEGTIFKVKLTLPEIQALVTPGLLVPPTGWDAKGTAVLAVVTP